MEKLLLKPTETATLLGYKRATVYRLIKEKNLPVVRLGGHIRIPRRALEKWISSHIHGQSRPRGPQRPRRRRSLATTARLGRRSGRSVR